MRPTTLLFVVAIAITATSCADYSVAPKSLAAPTAPRMDAIDSSMCRSGYNMANHTCNDQ